MQLPFLVLVAAAVTIAWAGIATVDPAASLPLAQATPGINAQGAVQGCTGSLTFGQTYTGCSLSAASEVDAYGIPGAAGHRVRARGVETSGSLNLRLRIVLAAPTPGPCTPGNPAVTGEVTCVLNSSNSHTLQADAFPSSGTGEYSLYLQDLTAPVNCSPMAYSETRLDALTAAGEVDCYTFSGTAGKQVRLHQDETSGTLVTNLELIRPDGTMQSGCTPGNPEITGTLDCTLDSTGTHTVLVSDFNPGTRTGGYHVTLICLSAPCDSAPHGVGFTLTTEAGPGVRARWNPAVIADQCILRIIALTAGSTNVTVPCSAGTYLDTTITPGFMYCYVFIMEAKGAPTFPDPLCALVGGGTTSNASAGFALDRIGGLSLNR